MIFLPLELFVLGDHSDRTDHSLLQESCADQERRQEGGWSGDRVPGCDVEVLRDVCCLGWEEGDCSQQQGGRRGLVAQGGLMAFRALMTSELPLSACSDYGGKFSLTKGNWADIRNVPTIVNRPESLAIAIGWWDMRHSLRRIQVFVRLLWFPAFGISYAYPCISSFCVRVAQPWNQDREEEFYFAPTKGKKNKKNKSSRFVEALDFFSRNLCNLVFGFATTVFRLYFGSLSTSQTKKHEKKQKKQVTLHLRPSPSSTMRPPSAFSSPWSWTHHSPLMRCQPCWRSWKASWKTTRQDELHGFELELFGEKRKIYCIHLYPICDLWEILKDGKVKMQTDTGGGDKENTNCGTVVFSSSHGCSRSMHLQNLEKGEGEGVGGDPRGAEAPHPGRCGLGLSWA